MYLQTTPNPQKLMALGTGKPGWSCTQPEFRLVRTRSGLWWDLVSAWCIKGRTEENAKRRHFFSLLPKIGFARIDRLPKFQCEKESNKWRLGTSLSM